MRQFLYDSGIWLASRGLRIAAWFQPKTKKWLDAQSGLLSTIASESKGINKPVWVHCASLGEFEQGRPIIEKIKESHPNQDIVLSFFSPSGYEVRKDYPNADRVFYLPIDTQSNARAFLDAINPALAIFVKYEIWPNYLSELKQRKVPSVLVSANFQDKSKMFGAGGGFLREALFKFDRIFVQDQSSKELLSQHNYFEVDVVGDTRIDRVLNLAGQSNDNPILESFCGSSEVLVAGSTWSEDEELLKELLRLDQDLKLVLAPHEIDMKHLSKVEGLFGSDLIRFSQMEQGESGDNKRVLLIDNIGMLASLYDYGFCAFIGGGFGAGIHNILEAAVYGIPVAFGPNNRRFMEAQDLKGLEVAFEVNNAEELHQVISKTRSEKFQSSAKRTLNEYFEKEKGATQKVYAFIKSFLDI